MGRLIQSIRERIRQVEDTVEGLRLTAEQDTALGPVGDDLRALLRQQALLELQATTRQQAQALQRLGDADFVEQANQQFIIGLRAQIAELDQQIEIASSPEARALRQQLADAQRSLESVEELPFNAANFIEDRRDALVRQVEEAEALVGLSSDPQTVTARRQLQALNLAEAGRQTAQQIEQFEAFAQQRRENDRLQLELGILETQEAQRRVGQFEQLNRQAAQTAQSLRIAQLEQELAEFSGQFTTLLRRQEESLRLRLRNAQLAEEVARFEGNAPQRAEARQLQQRLSQLQQIEDAQFALNNLETEYFDIGRAGLADLITGARSLRDVARQVLDQILRRTTERFVDSALLPAAFGGGGGGGQGIPGGSGFLVPGGGGAPAGQFAGKPTVEVRIDARGGDAQSVTAAVDRAVPRIAEAAAEINLDRLSGSSVERYRFSQATQEDDD